MKMHTLDHRRASHVAARISLVFYTTWRVIAYEEERGIEDKKLNYAERRSFRPLPRSLACASGVGLQKQR
jgi:hypothetical protein